MATESVATDAHAAQRETEQVEHSASPVLEHGSTEAQRRAVESARRALTLASFSLAPERGELRDTTLARLLLREAFIRTGRAARADDPQRAFPFAGELMTLHAARAALEARADLPKRANRARFFDLALRLEADASLDFDNLRELEAWLADILRFLGREPVPWLRSRWFSAAAVLLVALLVVLLPRFIIKPAWTEYKWRASSASGGYATSGTLGETEGQKSIFFHTDSQRGPWFLVDMNAPRSIHEVTIKNRSDCCFERGLPLIVEVSMDGKAFTLVGWRDKAFAEWTVKFEPTVARYVRVRADATTYLHFEGIAIQ